MTYFHYTNNAVAIIPLSISSTDTTFSVETGDGALFPSSFPFRVTLWDGSSYASPGDDPDVEIVEVTDRTDDTFTVSRGKESTTGVSHPADSKVALLVTAGTFEDTTYGINPRIESHISATDAHHAKYTDVEAIDAINGDTDHGSTANHDYFSGSHADLTTVGATDHHSNANDPTADEKAAMTNANSPSSSNAFATMDDVSGGSSGYRIEERFIYGTLTIGTMFPVIVRKNGTITESSVTVGVLPEGSSVLVDVRKNGNTSTDSIHNSDAAIEITTTETATNGFYTSTGSLDSGMTSVSVGDVLYFEITQIGSTTSGEDMVARVIIE